MRQILITGGAGFIGSCLCEKLIEDKNNFVVIVDNLTTGSISKLPTKHKGRWKFIKCNVNNYRDISKVFLFYNFDYIFHYAAVVGVQRTQENQKKVLKDLHGIEHILDLSKNSKIKKIFFSSSSEVYGESVEFPQNENVTPLNSRIPYAIVKNACEAYLKSYNKEYGIKYTIFRFFNTYGSKQNKDFVIPRFLNLALTNSPITIYGNGSQTRTFCFIDDNIDATYSIFSDSCKNDNYPNDIINIGGDNEIKIIDLAKTIIKLTNSKSELIHLPPLKDGDMQRRLPDITKMKKILKRELISLENGIEKILKDTSYIMG